MTVGKPQLNWNVINEELLIALVPTCMCISPKCENKCNWWTLMHHHIFHAFHFGVFNAQCESKANDKSDIIYERERACNIMIRESDCLTKQSKMCCACIVDTRTTAQYRMTNFEWIIFDNKNRNDMKHEREKYEKKTKNNLKIYSKRAAFIYLFIA